MTRFKKSDMRDFRVKIRTLSFVTRWQVVSDRLCRQEESRREEMLELASFWDVYCRNSWERSSKALHRTPKRRRKRFFCYTSTHIIKIDVIRYCNDRLNQEQLVWGAIRCDVVKVDTLFHVMIQFSCMKPTTMHRYFIYTHHGHRYGNAARSF